ncbi:MAG TPA: hypothetical protein VG479_10550 [Gaiellaceae bacterium]|nr:hypothetical protein [Gaiellaceae bacterium]
MARNDRSSDDVVRDIATEREELVAAVDDLRGGVRRLSRKLPVVVAGAFAVGVAAAGAVVGIRHLRD